MTNRDAYITTASVEATDWEIVEEKKTLSDKILDMTSHSIGMGYKLNVEDVKEALKELIEFWEEEKTFTTHQAFRDKAKAIFGERLT